MQIDVALAGVSWPWMLRCARELEAWFRSVPWLGQGATSALVAPASTGDILGLVKRSVYQWDTGRSDVRIIDLEVTSDLLTALAGWLGMKIPDRGALATALGDDLVYRPAVFVVMAPSEQAGRILDEAEELREWIVKLDHPRGPAFVVVHGGPTGVARGSLRADRGWPVGLADAVTSSPRGDAWRQYLHLRIAWEVNGELVLASACDEHFNNLQLGDDAGCEAALNEFAHAQFRALTSRQQQELRKYYAGSGWRPSIERRDEVAPWIARALLLEGVPGSTMRALRAELICRPLVERLLYTCFQIEASLRGRIVEQSGACADDQAHAAFERYRDLGARCVERDLYPPGHPAPPHDVWDFVSLASLLRGIEERAPELRMLRNSLSYGHYASWHAVSLLKTAIARLGL